MASAALGRGAATVALGAAWLLFFCGQLTSGGVPYYRDNLVTLLPLRHYIHARLQHGELPQWFPFESLGVPLIGQIATGLFHPATWLLLPFDAFTALTINLLGAYLVGLIGAYRLARVLPTSRLAALTAALGFAFGGYALGVSSVLFYAMSQATLPWVALFAIRLARRQRLHDVAGLALCWALVFLAGDAQGFLLCAGLIGVIVLAARSRRAVGLGLGAGLTATLLCGIEYLPARQVTAQAMRVVGQASPTLGLSWALHPLRLPELLLGGYIPDLVRARVVGELLGGGTAVFCTTIFVGSLGLACVAAGLRAKRPGIGISAGVAAVALWLSLGDRGGLLPLVQAAWPLWTRFRYPEKFLAFFWLGLCPLVAYGVERWLQERRVWAKALLGGAAACAVTGLVVRTQGAAEAMWAAFAQPLHAADPLATTLDAAWAAGFAWAALFLGLAGLVLIAVRQRPALARLLPLLVFAELWRVNAAHLPVVPRAWLAPPPAFAQAMHATQHDATPVARLVAEAVPSFPSTVSGPESERWQWTQSMRAALRPDVGGLYEIASLGHNMGATSRRDVALFGPHAERAPRLAPWFNACFRVRDGRRVLGPDATELGRDASTGTVLDNVPCRPRAFLAGTQSVATGAQALQRMQAAGGLAGDAVWEQGPTLPAAHGTVRWITAQPEHAILEVEADAATGLIVSDALAPGWHARLDGQAVPIYAALVVARGIVVPAGTHRVEFSYETPGLGPGALASGLGLLLIGLMLRGRRAPS